MDRFEAMRAFVRVVELGSFSKVGKELRIKQSTVSKWVAALEEQLSTQLIERTSRAQRVTESGHLFYERAKDILAAFESTAAQLQRVSPEVSGRLRVSAPVVFGRLFVVPHLATFLSRYPEVEIDLVLDDRYVRLVEDGFDVSIRVGTPIDSSLRAKMLAVTARHLVAAPAYLERAGMPRAPKDLQDHACLLHSGLSTGDTWVFLHDGKTTRAAVRGRFGANNSEALLALAQAGLGIALLASWLVRRDLERGTLVSLLGDYSLPDAPIQALTPPTRYVHPRVRVFLDFMADVLVDLR